MIKPLVITQRAEKRLKQGHLWIYSNEIEQNKTPLKSFDECEQVAIHSDTGKLLAYAMLNPKNLICGKIIDTKSPLDKHLLQRKIQEANQLRENYYSSPFYRLCYAEADFIPGLIIDRFNAHAVVQITHACLEPFSETIAEILLEDYSFHGVIVRLDAQSRRAEGLEQKPHLLFGDTPEELEVTENNSRFILPATTGQKTGWFYDHRDNRAKAAEFAQGKRVLDVFSYIGAWGFACLAKGAAEVVSIDSQSNATTWQKKSAELNGFSEKIDIIQQDAFKALERLAEEKEKFDLVILDPPAFIKKKKDKHNGEKAYQRINELGIRLLSPGGFLMSASCSMHLSNSTLQRIVQKSARHIDRRARLCYKGGHPLDHPVHPGIPETEYLKAQLYQIVQS